MLATDFASQFKCPSNPGHPKWTQRVTESHNGARHVKGYGKLCQKMVSFLVYHFVSGHLGVLRDVAVNAGNQIWFIYMFNWS